MSSELIPRATSIAPTIGTTTGYASNVRVTTRCAHEAQASADYTDVPVKGRLPGELHAALIAYATYYRETIGEPIEVWPLVLLMLQRFVETDREFQTWRRRMQNGSGTGSVTS